MKYAHSQLYRFTTMHSERPKQSSYSIVLALLKVAFFQKVSCIFQIAPKMCRKNYPEHEILIITAILLGIPKKWQCLSLSFYGNSLYTKITKDLPVNCQRIVFLAHFLGNLKNASYFLKKSKLYTAKATLRLADAIMWQLGTVHYFNQFISFNFASTALRKNL